MCVHGNEVNGNDRDDISTSQNQNRETSKKTRITCAKEWTSGNMDFGLISPHWRFLVSTAVSL